jgi:hypothetical protein
VYVENIFEARGSDFKKQTHKVCYGAGDASFVGVGVLR